MNKYPIINFRVSKDFLKQLEKARKKAKMGKSEFIREAIMKQIRTKGKIKK